MNIFGSMRPFLSIAQINNHFPLPFSKCTILESITYDEENIVVTSDGDTIAHSKIINNLHMSFPIVTSLEMSETNTEGIEESYSFGESDTSEVGASLEISKSAAYGNPVIGIFLLQ